MLEKTNLEKVKMIARALLMTEIHETEFSPAVVQHPFTSSGITVLPRDGILQLGDICKNEKDLAAWQDYMKNRINNSTCAYYIYMITNKPYGLTCKLYLLTADRALWRAAKRQMWNGKIILGRIRLACGTESSYTLLCCAKDLNKLDGIVRYAGDDSIKTILKLAEYLDEFEFVERAENYEDVGQYAVDITFGSGIPDELEEHIDLNSVGRHMEEEYEGRFVKGGFVYNNKKRCIEEVLEDARELKIR